LRYFNWLSRPDVGFPKAADSDWYIQYAHNLMHDFKIGTDMNDIMYIGYNLLLTGLLAIVKDPVRIMFIQVVVASLCVILVFKISRMLFNLRTAIIASYFYAFLWDITLWSGYILTDSFFISLLLLSVFLLIKCYQSPKRVYKISFAISAFWLLIFRPSGIFSVAFLLIYILINLPKHSITGFLKKYRYPILGAVGAIAVVFFILLAGGQLNSLIDSMQFNAKKVLYNQYANGWIYDHPSPQDHKFRPDYSIDILNSLILSFIINNWDHIGIIYFKRAIAFFGRWVWSVDISTWFGIKLFISHMIPTGLFTIGTFAVFYNKMFKRTSIIWLLILSVFIFCLIFFIDGMFRYKAPGTPFIVIAVAYGADRILFTVIYIAKKLTEKLPWTKRKFSL
jgi:4-amino-4-deoxy-L-arabinose transferase-like glycosyltransferase